MIGPNFSPGCGINVQVCRNSCLSQNETFGLHPSSQVPQVQGDRSTGDVHLPQGSGVGWFIRRSVASQTHRAKVDKGNF